MALQCDDFVPLSKDLWQNNKNATSCFICKSKFNMLRRRHHCRNCGIVICNNCSKHHVINTQKYRICHDCYPKIIKSSKQISNKIKPKNDKNWINRKPKFAINGTTKNHQQILNNFVIKDKSFKYKQDIEEAFKLWHQYRKWQNNHEWTEKQEKKDNIKIYSHSISNTNTDIIKCETIIPYSTTTILAVLLNENHVQKWQSNNDWKVEEFTKIEKCSKYTDIIYFSMKSPVAFISYRDAIVIRFIYTLEDGSILMGLRSIIHNKYPPKQTRVRAHINLEFWHITPDWENNDTSNSKIIYYSHVSFGGNLPNWLINQINSKYHTSKLLQLNNYIKSMHDTLQKPGYPMLNSLDTNGEDVSVGFNQYKGNKNNTRIRKRKYLNNHTPKEDKQKISGSNINEKESETQHRNLVIITFVIFCLIGFILFWRLQSAESLPLLYYIEVIGKYLFDNIWFIFSKITRTYYDILNRNLSNELNRFKFIFNVIYILISTVLYGICYVIGMMVKIILFILTSFYDNLYNNSQSIIICVNAVVLFVLSIIIVERFHMKTNNYQQRNKYRNKVSSIINGIYNKYETIIPYFIFGTFVLFWVIGKSLTNYIYKIDAHSISNFDQFMMFGFVICTLIYITVIFSFCMMIYQSIENTFFKSKNDDKSSGVSRKTALNNYVINECEWEWMDDNYQWKPYTNDINKKINSLKNGSDSFKVKIGSYTYLIKKNAFLNSKGTQRNIKTNKIRNIRKKIINCNYNKRKYKNNANIISNEYKNVRELFFKTVNKYNYEIIKIENVCNIYKDKVYEANISSKCNEYNKSRDEIERLLWHGTSYANIQNILKTGFDRTYNTQSLYGKGTYFALNASYSVSYSPTSNVIYGIGYKYMLLCKVMTGDYTIGNRTQNKIAKKSDGTEYDSMVDKLNNPSIFVIWRDYHAIPKYLITFKQK